MKSPSRQQHVCPQTQVADAVLDAATGGLGTLNYFTASNIAHNLTTLAGETWASLYETFGSEPDYDSEENAVAGTRS